MTAQTLSGRRVLVTRNEEADGPLSRALAELGATPVLAPVLELAALMAPEEVVRRVGGALSGAQWLVLTSPRAVDLLERSGLFHTPPPGGLRVAVVGEATGQAVRRSGWPVDLVPEAAGQDGLTPALLAYGPGSGEPPVRVVFPASSRAGTGMEEALAQAGFRVDRIHLYGPRALSLDPTAWRAHLVDDPVDALTFTSPSAVEALAGGLASELVDAARALPAGVQGPVTGEAARSAGWARVAEARPRSYPGLARALAHHLSASPVLTSTRD